MALNNARAESPGNTRANSPRNTCVNSAGNTRAKAPSHAGATALNSARDKKCIPLTKITAEQNEAALSYHRVRGRYFLVVIFAATITLVLLSTYFSSVISVY